MFNTYLKIYHNYDPNFLPQKTYLLDIYYKMQIFLTFKSEKKIFGRNLLRGNVFLENLLIHFILI